MTPSVSMIMLISTCAALDIPWNPSIDKENTVYMKTQPKTRSNNPQWLFFVSTEITTDNNSSTPLVEWEFISHMTITPDQCAMITDVVQMLDNALQRANPDVQNVTSAALRLGNQECVDGECPCTRKDQEGRRRALVTHQLLEVKTRSSSPDLKPPLQFPLRVEK